MVKNIKQKRLPNNSEGVFNVLEIKNLHQFSLRFEDATFD